GYGKVLAGNVLTCRQMAIQPVEHAFGRGAAGFTPLRDHRFAIGELAPQVAKRHEHRQRQIELDAPIPHFHCHALRGVGAEQRRLRVVLLEITADGNRFRYATAVVELQHGQQPHGIAGAKIGAQILARKNIDRHELDGTSVNALFGQKDAYPARVGGGFVLIKFHGCNSGRSAGGNRSAAHYSLATPCGTCPAVTTSAARLTWSGWSSKKISVLKARRNYVLSLPPRNSAWSMRMFQARNVRMTRSCAGALRAVTSEVRIGHCASASNSACSRFSASRNGLNGPPGSGSLAELTSLAAKASRPCSLNTRSAASENSTASPSKAMSSSSLSPPSDRPG